MTYRTPSIEKYQLKVLKEINKIRALEKEAKAKPALKKAWQKEYHNAMNFFVAMNRAKEELANAVGVIQKLK